MARTALAHKAETTTPARKRPTVNVLHGGKEFAKSVDERVQLVKLVTDKKATRRALASQEAEERVVKATKANATKAKREKKNGERRASVTDDEVRAFIKSHWNRVDIEEHVRKLKTRLLRKEFRASGKACGRRRWWALLGEVIK